MNLIEFPEQTVVIAKDQPDYGPMPAHLRRGDSTGTVTCCWRLSWRERLQLLFTGTIWHQIMTFQNPLQPQLLLVEKPSLAMELPKARIGGGVLKCARCKAEFQELDKWVLVYPANKQTSAKALGRAFCTKSCAESFAQNCIGEMQAIRA